MWRSGSAFALHAKGPGFEPLHIHFLTYRVSFFWLIFASLPGSEATEVKVTAAAACEAAETERENFCQVGVCISHLSSMEK